MSATRKTRFAMLSRDARGMALVEFALSLPLVLALGLGGFELANYALTNLRVNQIALSVADNAGRVITRIDETDVVEVFAGARVTGEPIGFQQNGRVVLSSLQHNGRTGTTAGQMINWQRCWGSLAVAPSYGRQGAGRTNGSLQSMGRPGRAIASLPNTAVMFVEVSYRYSPLIGGVLSPQTIRYESAFIVRGRTQNDISNTGPGGQPYDFAAETGGTPTLLFFGFTNCPDICPTTMADIALAMRKVDPAVAAETSVVFVTTDPARDTPDVLGAYLDQFDADLATQFTGLTGDQAQVDQAQLAAGVPLAEDMGQTHSSLLLLYGTDGEADVAFDAGNTGADIAHDLALVAAG